MELINMEIPDLKKLKNQLFNEYKKTQTSLLVDDKFMNNEQRNLREQKLIETEQKYIAVSFVLKKKKDAYYSRLIEMTEVTSLLMASQIKFTIQNNKIYL